MVRGKEAIQSANRRAAAAEESMAKMRAETEAERAAIREERQRYKVELAAVRRDIDRLADERAAEEVARREELLNEERRLRGTDEGTTVWLLLKNDMFMRAASQYISMRDGIRPERALGLVLTWATNRDYEEPPKPTVDFLIGVVGVATDGWVALTLESASDVSWSRWGINPISAITLDRAQAEGHRDIHPDYRPEWYGETPEIPQRPDAMNHGRSMTRTAKTALGHSGTKKGVPRR